MNGLPFEEDEAALRADAEPRGVQAVRQLLERHKLGRATTRVTSKMGIAFEEGDLCLYVEASVLGERIIEADSHRTGANTMISASKIVPA